MADRELLPGELATIVWRSHCRKSASSRGREREARRAECSQAHQQAQVHTLPNPSLDITTYLLSRHVRPQLFAQPGSLICSPISCADTR